MNVPAHRIEGFKDLDPSKYCYYQDKGGIWYLYVPGCGLGNLSNHEVTENANGTITVKPSILVTGHDSGERVQKHGYLENGILRDA